MYSDGNGNGGGGGDGGGGCFSVRRRMQLLQSDALERDHLSLNMWYYTTGRSIGSNSDTPVREVAIAGREKKKKLQVVMRELIFSLFFLTAGEREEEKDEVLHIR